ncbi:hypothetical protein DYB38_003296 [Aphanomyces astaci]|uniref:Xaa-Pro dipeptidyl-peptidase C-terminal domain-containing protein n=1 Tax=Aphanomyces astaci TaxID=112090 RepID=A0A397CR74_APHAT|nr:hypothetical protein DYB38_003296 [Aphanomyces astaci]
MSGFMSNMIISMVLMVVVQNAVNSYFGFETPAVCKEGVNDMTWLGKPYESDPFFHPKSIQRTSHFIALEDGTQLAADLYHSEQATYNDLKQPTVIHFTRHGRGYTLDFPLSSITAGGDFINPRTGSYIPRIVTTSYAWLVVDIRGTGASFGAKEFDFVDQEAVDAKNVIDWVTQQDWSNGEVSLFGFGTDGVSALVAATSGHTAVKALVLHGVPLDLYDSAFFPGGLHNYRASSMYSGFSAATDANKRWDQVPHLKSRLMMSTFGGNVAAVNKSEPQVRVHAAAVAEHVNNGNFHAETKDILFRDDKLSSLDRTFEQINVPRLFQKLADTNIPVLNMAGYYDMGSSRSAILLHRYLTGTLDDETHLAYGLSPLAAKTVASTQYSLILGPWSHSNVDNIDPYAEGKTRCFEHIEQISRFFDYHLYNADRAVLSQLETEDPIHYYTLAEGKWRSTTEWPPASIDEAHTYFFSLNNTLVEDVADVVDGAATAEFAAGFNSQPSVINRWNSMDHIFLNKPTYSHNRDDLAKKAISFTTPPLHQQEATGEMTVKVFFSVDAPGVSLIAYLEDYNNIAPIEHSTMVATKTKVRGGTTYITEAVLNPIHQSIGPGNPLHTFKKDASRTIEPGVVYEATFNFYPTSYFLPHQHQFRVSIVGQETATFDNHVADKATNLTVHFSEEYPSSVTIRSQQVPLPIVKEVPREAAATPITDVATGETPQDPAVVVVKEEEDEFETVPKKDEL